MVFIFIEKKPRAFLTAIDMLLWFKKESRVFAIPIPAINMALIETRDKNWEKLSITLLKPLAEFSGYLNWTLVSSLNISLILSLVELIFASSENFTLYS